MNPIKHFRDLPLHSEIARDLLAQYVPGHVKQIIVTEFNAKLRKRTTNKPVSASTGTTKSF